MPVKNVPFQKGPKKNENPHRINEAIKAPMVRVVGEHADNEIHSVREALKMAEEAGLDLVEISPDANPPVCKIIDYSKFLFDLKKKQKEMKAKAKASQVVVKEIGLGQQIDVHDFEFKLNHAKRFLSEGAKVKVVVLFRGRAIAYKEQGEIQLLKFAQALEEMGKVESMPKLEGKRMIMIIAPKK